MLQALEALSYFQDTHSVWTGWGGGFPYELGSHINISEDVILKENFLEVLTDYYRWNFISQKENNSYTDRKKEISLPKFKIETKRAGRPSLEKEIIEAYRWLEKDGQIDISKPINSYYQPIRDTIKTSCPHIEADTNLCDEAIRKRISPLFQAKKENP